MAAYYHLAPSNGRVVHHTKRKEPGYIIDFAGDGTALGVEIICVTRFSLKELNRILEELGQAPAKREEFRTFSDTGRGKRRMPVKTKKA
jgi:hypothetical protein